LLYIDREGAAVCAVTCDNIAEKVRENQKIPDKLREGTADALKKLQDSTRSDAFPKCEIVINIKLEINNKEITGGEITIEIKF